MHVVKLRDFVPALVINALSRVEDERVISRGCFKLLRQVRVERERMGPAKTRKDAHWKIGESHICAQGIVMTDGSDAAEQVTDCSPPYLSPLGDLFVALDDIRMNLMNLTAPFGRVPI